MIITILASLLVVAVTVLIHYESLISLSIYVPRWCSNHRLRVLLSLLSMLVVHIVEVALFAMTYYAMINQWQLGHLIGNIDGSMIDYLYFSFTVYSTLGFGDIEPMGHVRFLVGMEAVCGLLLITWSASFIFLEMQRFWRLKDNER